MVDFAEALFRQIAVQLGYVTATQAAGVADERATTAADALPLDLLLVERGLLTAEQAGRVLRGRERLLGPVLAPGDLLAEDRACAQIARERGLATAEAVNQALSVQAGGAAAGTSRRLVEILFESGALTLDAALEILAARTRAELTCRVCSRRYVDLVSPASSDARCPRCRTAPLGGAALPAAAASAAPAPLPGTAAPEPEAPVSPAAAHPLQVAPPPITCAGAAATPAPSLAAPPTPAPLSLADSAVRRADDRFFGQYAVRSGLLAEEQLQDLVQQQAEVERAGVHLTLPDLCQLRQILTYRQVEHARQAQKLFQAREEDRLLGMILVRRQVATNEQVQAALAVQREAYRTTHRLPRLKETLLARGGLTPAQIVTFGELESQVRAHLAGGPASAAAAAPALPAPPAPAPAPAGLGAEPTGSLIVESGPDSGRTIRLGPCATIGRVAPCEVLLSDRNISRQHLRIEYSSTTGQHVVRDLESFNGSYLNGDGLREPRALKAGDRIRIGATVMRFTPGGAEDARSEAEALDETRPLAFALSAPPAPGAQTAASASQAPGEDDGTLPDCSTPPLPLPTPPRTVPAAATGPGRPERSAGTSARMRQLLRALGEAALSAGIQGAEALLARQATQRLNALKGAVATAGTGSHWVDGADGAGPSWSDPASADLGTAVSALAEALERLGRHVLDHDLHVPGREELIAQIRTLEGRVGARGGSHSKWPWIAAAAALGLAVCLIAAIYFGPDSLRLTDNIVIQRGPRDVFLSRVLWGAGVLVLLHMAYFVVLLIARLRDRQERRLRLS